MFMLFKKFQFGLLLVNYFVYHFDTCLIFILILFLFVLFSEELMKFRRIEVFDLGYRFSGFIYDFDPCPCSCYLRNSNLVCCL
jgi:hypothetical protein